ncbi:MAG: 5-formyltetrahydrofolate cyclo-ligase [Neisseria animaloris]|nr:5-formyltetrahydrofolate cyclo-ligase [Neisseria animaloris]
MWFPALNERPSEMPRTADKASLRRQFRRARAKLGKSERRQATRKINNLLKRYIRRNSRIGVYWPIGGELRLDGLIEAVLKRGAKPYLPYIEPHSLRLWFTPYSGNRKAAERQRGNGKLYIPQFAGEKIRAHRLNLLLVPVVGIDRQGCRLGQGGGYYDVSLAACRHRLQPRTLGVGFACQLCDELPRKIHDTTLNGFVCELGEMRFKMPKCF